MVDHGLTRRILGEINTAQEALAAKGGQGVVVVSASLRRSFSTFLRSHGGDAIVLAGSELPENRRVDIVASIGAQEPPAPTAEGP